MSVQLILQPQNIQGFSNSISVITSEMVTNGVNFGGVNTATDSLITSSNIFQDILDNHPATILNTWYKFKSDALASYPTESSGNLSFTQLADTSVFTGIYQQMTNLIVGQVYDATISTPSGTPTNSVFGLTVSNSIGTFNTFIFPNSSTASIQFTATSTNPTIILWSFSDIVETIAVSFISITGANQLFNILNGDGQVICDLYEDEDLPLTLSVDEFKNVAEKVQSYSKAFNLPSTKRNNRIFNAIFEITRSYDGLIFSPYKRTQCVLKQDGFILFEGFLRLLDVTDKEGEISYNVNLYSEVIALADVLKDRTFSDLDFSELEHRYNIDEIKNSWNNNGTGITYTNPSTSGFRDANLTLKYPFVDWNHQYILGGTTNYPVLNNLESSFRPFINIKYLIDRIFNAPDTPFTYTSDFFNTDEFKLLYMDFNWGADANPNNILNTGIASYVANESPAVYATTTFSNMVFEDSSIPVTAGFDNATNTFTASEDNTLYNIFYIARVWATKDDSVLFRWRMVKSGVESFLNPASATLEGSAIVVVNYTLTTGGSVVSVDVIDGGHYPSGAPTITIDSQFGNGATFIITMAGNAISTIVVDTPGGSYFGFDVMEFNAGTFISPEGITSGNISETLNPGDTLELQWKAVNHSDSVRQDNTPYNNNTTIPNSRGTLNVRVGITGLTSDVLLQTLRGELGQWDFLKGLITMFNLVTLPDEDNPNNIKIEPYVDIFINNSDSIQHDWTDKIDVSEMKLTPLTDLKRRTIFKFVEDDDDYSFNQYKRNVGGQAGEGGFLYGSLEFDATEEFNILDGKDEIIAEPFASTIIKPLMDNFPDFITPAVYAYNSEDGVSQGFDNSPRILYNNGVKTLSSCTYEIPDQNSVTGNPTESQFLQFSHLTQIPVGSSASDFNFGLCQLLIDGGTPSNLYSRYWSPYYNQLYNPNTRIMTIKVNLNAGDINTFKFNDTVYLKNRTFRVNKIDYKPNDLATVEFILIP